MLWLIEFTSGLDGGEGLTEREESTVIYTFLVWILMDEGAIYIDGMVYEKKKKKTQLRLCGMKVSDEILEGVWNHLVSGLGSKNDLILLRMKAYPTNQHLTFALSLVLC